MIRATVFGANLEPHEDTNQRAAHQVVRASEISRDFQDAVCVVVNRAPSSEVPSSLKSLVVLDLEPRLEDSRHAIRSLLSPS
jgi:hypothetical protein